MEIRSFSDKCAPSVEGRTIEGYALIFNQESRVMFDWDKKRFFKEIIKPGAITQELINQSDIKALVEHDRSRMLARSYNGTGSLQLTIDDVGLKYRFEAPQTSDADYVIEMINRGNMFGSSFAYTANETEDVSYSKDSDGHLIREVKRIDGLFDVSPVSDPAYMQTKVSVRKLDTYFQIDNPDKEKIEIEIKNLRNLSK